ncbi:MAG: hypothetical protein QOJ11_2974 [Frankiales bacterium]|nr:hypothetical protein [Frankiales bacterium]
MNETTDSDRAGDRIQAVTTAGVAGLALGAFLLSYDALHQLARTSHVPAVLAWLWPLIVDGFILVGCPEPAAVAGPVVGEDPLDADAGSGGPGDRAAPEPGRGGGLLATQDLAVGQPGWSSIAVWT